MRDVVDIWAVFDKEMDYDTVRCWETETEAIMDKDKCDTLYPNLAPHEIIRACESIANDQGHQKELIRAVEACCTCGGGGPNDKHTCPACHVYHALATVPNDQALPRGGAKETHE